MTQNGLPFALGRRAGGWLGAERGSFEFSLKPGKDGLRVDLGAGRVLAFQQARQAQGRAGGDRRHLRLGRFRRDLDDRPRGRRWESQVSGPLVAGERGVVGRRASMPTRSR